MYGFIFFCYICYRVFFSGHFSYLRSKSTEICKGITVNNENTSLQTFKILLSTRLENVVSILSGNLV